MKKGLALIFAVIFLVSVVGSGEREEYFVSGQWTADIPVRMQLQDSTGIINATRTWSLSASGVNITGVDQTICVLDSGVNFTHPDLLNKNLTCNIDCMNKGCLENCTLIDDNGHGTHVAGILVANGTTMKGVAPDAHLISLKVLDQNGNGFMSNVTSAINWCVNNASKYNITVISISLGTEAPTLYDSYCDGVDASATAAVNNAIANNISVVAATGNDGNATHIALPACITNVTAVGNTDKNDGIASDSNYNNLTDLFAPGVSINSTKKIGGYETRSGTSMATPHVSAAFALVRQFYNIEKGRALTSAETETAFKDSGILIDTGSENISRIDVYLTILSLINPPNVTLDSPINGSYIASQQNFTCNVSTSITSSLTNITFYLYNSTSDTIYTETSNVSGVSNSSSFNYTLAEEAYGWNCRVEDNQNNSFAEANYTITYDVTYPLLNLSSPANSSTQTSSNSVKFEFNLTDTNIANCTLIINGAINTTNTSLSGVGDSVSINLPNAVYNWSVNCSDLVLQVNESETRILTVNYQAPAVEETPSGGSGGGGGGGVITYSITDKELSEGVSKNLRINDRMKFNLLNGTYYLTLKSLKGSLANILVESVGGNVTLGVNESKKLSFEDNYNNLQVRLLGISSTRGEVYIKELNELILKPEKVNAFNETDATGEDPNGEVQEVNGEDLKVMYIIIVAVVLSAIIIIVSREIIIRRVKKMPSFKKKD